MLDATVAAVWFGVNAGLIAGLWKRARRWHPADAASQSLLHLLVLLTASVVAVSLILGAVGWLSAWGLGAGCAAIAAVSFAWRSSSTGTIGLARASGDSGGQAHFGATTFGAEHTNSRRKMSQTPAWKLWLWVWCGIASVLAGIIVMRGVIEFPNDWDSLKYHIPLIDLWLQTGSLYVPQNPAWSNPSNAELFGYWLVAPFSGDFWIGLANVPVALVVILGALELGRQLGLTRGTRQLCAIAVVASAVFLKEIRTTENDIAVLGFFAAALAYGIRYVRSDRAGDLLLGSACLGLLAGMKYYALGYAAVAWTAVVWLAFRQGGRAKGLKVAAAGMAGIGLLAGYWYVRNLVASGTPFFPLGFTDRTNVLAAVRPSTWSSTLLGNGRWELLPQVVTAVWNVTGPCHVATLLALPSTVIYLMASGWIVGQGGEGKAWPRDLRWFLLLAMVGALAVFAVTPFVVDSASPWRIARDYRVVRFGLCPQVLAIFNLGQLVSDALWSGERWKARRSRVGYVVVLAVCGMFAGLVVAQTIWVCRRIFEKDWLEIALVGIDLCVLGVIAARVGIKMGPGWRTIGAVAGAIAIGCATAWQANWWHRDFAQYYDLKFRQTVFCQLAKSEASRPTIAVMGYRSYPFFGSRRQFCVVRPRRCCKLFPIREFGTFSTSSGPV